MFYREKGKDSQKDKNMQADGARKAPIIVNMVKWD